jgi:uncharacterized protein (DUF1330 family)
MSYEMLVGLNVTNDEMYQEYRAAMKPILIQYDGGFKCDFKVSETLLPSENKDINRVFIIYFKDEEAMESFFSNPEYLKIKENHFSNSVSSAVILSINNASHHDA